MAHHAVFLENIKELQAIEAEHGAGARPYIRGYIQRLRREDDHGEAWLRYVKVVNAQMGSDFITRTSDASMVENPETKPYFILIARLPNDKYGWQIGVTLSAKMKQVVELAAQRYGAKLVRTTDAVWQYGPRIGNRNWATTADKQAALHQLYSMA
jgi:hypothetical protein